MRSYHADSSDADPASRYRRAENAVRKMDAGQLGDTGPSSAAFTAAALRVSGTMPNMCLGFKSAGIVNDNACEGTSSRLGK